MAAFRTWGQIWRESELAGSAGGMQRLLEQAEQQNSKLAQEEQMVDLPTASVDHPVAPGRSDLSRGAISAARKLVVAS